MRDPARIDAMVELLRARWKENPDQRLGQLVCNYGNKVNGQADPWNVEDDRMLVALAMPLGGAK